MAYYCLLNDEKRFIVCVDPKCGCTTIKDWFNHTLTVPRTHIFRDIGEFCIPAETLSDYHRYLKIFVVRQPLRRLVSFYYAWVVNDNQTWCFADQAGEVGLLEHTFREFVETLSRLAERGTPFQHHLTPQTRAVGTVRFDEVVKLEEFDQRIVAINRRLGVDYVPRHLNALPYGTAKRPDACDLSPRELRREPVYPFESFFDDALEQAVRALYSEDVRFYESQPSLR